MTDIAVIRALALGDMLCTIPTLRALRARFPGSRVALIGLPWARELVDRFPAYIDEHIEFPGFPGIPEVPVDPARTVASLAALQARRFALVVQLQGNGLVINEFASLVGARRIAGFVPVGVGPPREDPEDLWLPYPAYGSEVDRLLTLAAALGAPVSRRLEFPVTDDDRRQRGVLLTEHGVGQVPFAIVHAGSSRPERRWPPDRFALVAEELAAAGLAIVLTGTATESEVTAAVAASMRAPAIDLAGLTSLGAMAALVEGARIVVANDTGVSHLAAAIGTDSVTIFSASDRERWAPAGSGRNLAVGDGIGELEQARAALPVQVRPDDVLAAIRRLLKE